MYIVDFDLILGYGAVGQTASVLDTIMLCSATLELRAVAHTRDEQNPHVARSPDMSKSIKDAVSSVNFQ